MTTPSPPGRGAQNPGNRRRWLIPVIVAALAIDYATILRIEIFAEMRAGRSFIEALAHGNAWLTGFGVLISIVGVAAVLYLVFGRRN